MKTENYSSAIKYLYYILFFILPFVVLPINSELFEFNKMLFIYAVASLVLGVWLLRCMQEKRIIIKRTPFDIPLVLFLVSQASSTLFSIDQHTSFFGYYGRFNGGLLSTITYIFLYYAFVSNWSGEINKIIRRICQISIISSILVVLWGLPGWYNHDVSCLIFTGKFDNTCWTAQFRPAERMFSTLGQPNWLGAYLAVTFFLSIFVLFTTKSKWPRVLGFFGLLFTYLGILLSRSRSSMMSIVPGVVLLGLFLMFLLIKKNKWLTTSKGKLVVLLGAAILVFTLFYKTGAGEVDKYLDFSFLTKKSAAPVSVAPTPAAPSAGTSLEVIGPITTSLDIRKIVWQGAWELGMQYPLFGTGVETFGFAYYSVRPQAHNLTSEWDYLYNKAHNEYLNFLATTGWFGLGSVLLLMGWMGVVIMQRIRSNRADEDAILYYLALSGIFISICVTNFLGFSITVINVYWYVSLGLLVLYNSPLETVPAKKRTFSYIQLGIASLLVLWLLFSIGNYWFADYKYAQSDAALKSNEAGTAVNLLQEAIALKDDHVYEDKLSYALAQYAYVMYYQKDKTKAKEIMDVAEQLNMKSIQVSSQNVLYWKTRVKNQFIFYQMTLDKKYLLTGLAALDESTKLAPTDPKIPYFSATYYSLLYDDEKDAKQKELYKKKSLDSIEQTIALKSDYGDAYYLKIQLFKKYGDKAEEKKLLEWYIPRYAPGNAELLKELKEM